MCVWWMLHQISVMSENDAIGLLFRAFDRDGDGKINFAELATGLRLLPIADGSAETDETDHENEMKHILDSADNAISLLFGFDEDSDQQLGPVEFEKLANELKSFADDEATIQEILFLLLVKTLEAEDQSREEAFYETLYPLITDELSVAESLRDSLRDDSDGWMQVICICFQLHVVLYYCPRYFKSLTKCVIIIWILS